MSAEVFTPTPINVSSSAVAKVRALVEEEGCPELKLRVFVTGGGCSGFQYGFSFDEVQNEDDTLIQKEGVSVVVDSLSYQYLVGSVLDYHCLLYTSPSPRDRQKSRMPSSA